MNDLLEAECVLNHLANKKIITLIDWKQKDNIIHIKDVDYGIYFPGAGLSSNVQIRIIKRSGKFYILKSKVEFLSCRYQFDAEDILKECAVRYA
jgi:hypothetical protein